MKIFGDKKDDLGRQLAANKEETEMQLAGQMTEAELAYASDIQNQKTELTRWQQDLGDELVFMAHELKNEQLNDEGEWKPIKDTDGKDLPPMCSDACIMKIIRLLRPSANRNLMMSKYEKDYILQYLLRMSNVLTLDILLPERIRHRHSLALDTCSQIISIFQSYATPTFFRALGGNEKSYLGDITTNRHMTIEGQKPPQKKGLFGWGG